MNHRDMFQYSRGRAEMMPIVHDHLMGLLEDPKIRVQVSDALQKLTDLQRADLMEAAVQFAMNVCKTDNR